MEIPTLKTSRLVLRAFLESDAGPLHHILGERDVLRYFPSTHPPSRNQVEKLITGQLKHWEEHGYGWWAVELGSKSGLIGWSGLQFLPETEEVEVAYLLGRDHWGQGLASEAAQASIEYGFEHQGLDRIVAIVHPENTASRCVVEKLGMRFVDRSRYFGMDCVRYSMERSSFSAGRVATV